MPMLGGEPLAVARGEVGTRWPRSRRGGRGRGRGGRWRRRGTPCSSRRASAPSACGRRSRAAPSPTRWISLTSSSPVSVVGSTGGWSRPQVVRSRRRGRCRAGARRGRAARRAGPCTSFVVAPSISRRKASRRGSLEPADDAEVEQRGAAVGHHEEVPAVQVAVEDAVDQRPFHEGDHAGADDRRRCRCRRRCMPSTSSKSKPDSRSITSTRRVTSFGCGRGTT